MKFDVSTFSFLNEQDFTPGYSNVSQADLQQQVMDAMALGLAPEDMPEVAVIESFDYLLQQMKPACLGDFDDSYVLGVKADENGMVEQVYGPAVLSNEDGAIIIKAGANQFPLTINGTSATCGSLSGDIEVVEKGEAPNQYLSVSFDVYLPAPIDQGIEIPFVLDKDAAIPAKGKFKQDLKAGAIAQYLRKAGQGGSWVGMNDLSIGEYAVTALAENEPHPDYGRSWTMTLEGVGDVRSKGKQFQSKLAIRAPKLMKLLELGQPVTLLISGKKQLEQGVQISADFFTRPPLPGRLVAGAKPTAAHRSAAPAAPALAGAVDVPWE